MTIRYFDKDRKQVCIDNVFAFWTNPGMDEYIIEYEVDGTARATALKIHEVEGFSCREYRRRIK